MRHITIGCLFVQFVFHHPSLLDLRRQSRRQGRAELLGPRAAPFPIGEYPGVEWGCRIPPSLVYRPSGYAVVLSRVLCSSFRHLVGDIRCRDTSTFCLFAALPATDPPWSCSTRTAAEQTEPSIFSSAL
ncbi:hypothetical protein BC832DRAFT_565309 [Gaertneriomyces semiglobifer]|nr:hypothetical protein BC832DRAFT_565309 [Gaertneriomyces semiglobifer]